MYKGAQAEKKDYKYLSFKVALAWEWALDYQDSAPDIQKTRP